MFQATHVQDLTVTVLAATAKLMSHKTRLHAVARHGNEVVVIRGNAEDAVKEASGPRRSGRNFFFKLPRPSTFLLTRMRFQGFAVVQR